MITLGLVELVFAASLMFPGFFGGEGGVTTNRVMGEPFMGITFGPQIQVYYLIAFWCLLCMAAMYLFTRTPLGRMLNAVRDNPERVEFIGFSTQRIRYLAFMIAGSPIGMSPFCHAKPTMKRLVAMESPMRAVARLPASTKSTAASAAQWQAPSANASRGWLVEASNFWPLPTARRSRRAPTGIC